MITYHLTQLGLDEFPAVYGETHDLNPTPLTDMIIGVVRGKRQWRRGDKIELPTGQGYYLEIYKESIRLYRRGQIAQGGTPIVGVLTLRGWALRPRDVPHAVAAYEYLDRQAANRARFKSSSTQALAALTAFNDAAK